MSDILTSLIMQILAGAVGGNATGAAAKNLDLGTLGNTLAGAVGGGIGGQLLQLLLPALASGNTDLGPIVAQVAGGGAAGAMLTAIVGAVKNAMTHAHAK